MGPDHVANVLSVRQIQRGIDLIQNVHRGGLVKEQSQDLECCRAPNPVCSLVPIDPGRSRRSSTIFQEAWGWI